MGSLREFRYSDQTEQMLGMIIYGYNRLDPELSKTLEGTPKMSLWKFQEIYENRILAEIDSLKGFLSQKPIVAESRDGTT